MSQLYRVEAGELIPVTEPTYTDDDLAAAEAELAEEEATEPTESTTDEAPDEALEDKP